MKKEFTTFKKALDWIIRNANDELDFKNLREQLDCHHLFTGRYMLYTRSNRSTN
ncbi:MAG: hypothetical protein HKN76_14620 [Saprospiraceae bacterium]|nr:hypothetical protein [Saprospiraceae bacterium]